MARVTRSRQAASSAGETNVKIAAKRNTTITGAVTKTKKTIGKTRSNVKKASDQDENAVPNTQIKKVSNAKNSKSKGSVLNSKVLTKKDESLSHSKVLGLKSPALRDRTNTTNELVKLDTASKLSEKISLAENEQSNTKRTTRNTKKLSALKTNAVSVSIDKYIVKLPKGQSKDSNKNNLPQKEDVLPSKKTSEIASEKTDINENVDKSQVQLPSGKSKSETVSATKKAIKRKNISMEDVERILNEDDDEDVDGHEASDGEEKESVHEENDKKNETKTNKFFKHKGIEEITKPAVPNKIKAAKNMKSRAAKKMKNNDSTFSHKVADQRESTKPENKRLRTRVAKNYCETSRLSNSKDEAKKDTDKAIEGDHVPIYKTIKLSQEEKKGEPDEIYEFEASQDDGSQKGKKRKKTAKRPAVKRAKKTANLAFGFAPQPRKKPAKTVNNNVQFKVENLNKVNTNMVLGEKKVENAINSKTATTVNNVETNHKVPDDHPQIGDSTFEEVPTIKIVSDQKLEGNNRYRLTTTPDASKIAASGMNLFASKNESSSQPNQLNKMANHSLLRESMSPIRKLTDEFDTGSPWRAPPVDAFTRVRKVVQSTPQVKRQVALHEKKPLEHIADLNKKSFGSEETIHLSSVANKQPSKERSLEEMSTLKQDEPRKFGTVISNLSSSKSTNTTSASNNSATQKSPAQGTSLQSITPANIQHSPAKAISPPSADPNLPTNYSKLDLEDPDISFDNKENISPKSSPKKKIVAPSPFRFEKIRSSKRLAAITSTTKSPEKVTPTKIPESESEAGPSWLDKPKPAMKQTNLNNFLNLVDMPESANISTPHGIFDDVCSTPTNGKKPRKFVEEANVENAFGFDDFDCDDASNIENAPAVKIATESDVKKSVKGKLFPKARVKSAVPSRISENTVKKALLKDVLKKNVVEKAPPQLQEEEDSDSSGKNNENDNDQVVPYNESEKDKKKIMLDAISFSDTFDVLSENGEELEAKVPEEIPLFVDLEPAHFTEPPRKSYNKRKRNVCFEADRYESSDDDDEHEKKKAKKKKHKESHLKKEEKKRMEDWVKNVNKTFDEIEHFDLVVE